MRWKNALGLPARDKDGSRDMAVELCRELWPQCPDLQDASKLKKHHRRAAAFLIAAYGHASSGEPQGRMRERDPLSVILARLARRKKSEEEEPAPATPLATIAPPEAAPANPFTPVLAEGIFAKIPSENPFCLPNFSQDLSDLSFWLFVKVDLTTFISVVISVVITLISAKRFARARVSRK